MTNSYFLGETLDDVMRSIIEAIQAHGIQNKATKGANTELIGVLLEITNARARLSRTETRGKPFSCLGELCWYLAGTNKLEFISYYIPRYKVFAEGDLIFGGYGPRLFGYESPDQVTNVIELLRKRPSSRRAVIQLFDATDLVDEHRDIPCTCTLQFMIRDSKLHMITYMRSNDVFSGLPHDIFCFTMLQEILARSLSVELGTYKHAVGSLHLYESNEDTVQQFVDEGWQPTKMPMPPMPFSDPWPAIRLLLEAERAIRTGEALENAALEGLDPYWADLIRLLQIFRYSKDNDAASIEELRQRMSSSIYDTFIDKRLR
jgi:thymidylate synthase